MSGSYHLGIGPEHLAGNDGRGRYVFLPGDRSRAERIAERFEVTDRVISPRGHDSHLGVLRSEDGRQAVDVLAVSSGMGPPSVEIVAHELMEAGARRIVRVGSSASLNDRVTPGSVVIATGAVRDEGTSDRWMPREFPAVAHAEAVAAMSEGARDAGLAEHTFAGVVHSKDSLQGREFGVGPLADENLRYMRLLRESGVLATEMEASILFVMTAATSATHATSLEERSGPVPAQAACVLGVYGGEASTTADQRAITVACSGVLAWALRDLAR
ncbi:MAG: nucleoside phosphorylase [Proteobacteria bacterium]|nr:nucleoside phosphorylase [Pseudomonadota bacterium]